MFRVKTYVADCGDAAVRVSVSGGTAEQNWNTVRSIAARFDLGADGIVSVIVTLVSAGVSLMTASRALGNPGLVSPATIEKVKQAVAATGFFVATISPKRRRSEDT